MSVDRALGGASESCRTSRSSRLLIEWAISTKPKVSSTRYMCPLRNSSVDRALGGVSESCRTSRLQPPLSRVHYFDGGRFRARGTCVRGNIFMRMEGNLSVDRALGGVSESCRTIRSSRHLAEWAISTGGRFRARGTCVRGNIFMRMEGNLSVDRALGGASESCRTSRLHLQLSRVHYFDTAEGFEHEVHVSVGTFSCVWRGICRSIVP